MAIFDLLADRPFEVDSYALEALRDIAPTANTGHRRAAPSKRPLL